MTEHKKKILVIGTSGAVGMATRDAITEYIGADVIAYDRPITGTEQQIAAKEADRKNKADLYKKLVESNGTLLDGEQHDWLINDREKLPESAQGQVIQAASYEEAIRSGVDLIVIAAGLPRKEGMERKDVARVNMPIFKQYGEHFADIAAQEIEKNPEFRLPVIINAGNPVDTMTEILGRELHTRLAEHARIAIADNKPELARRLGAEARSLKGKIIGQGGILDGARAATAIHETMAIPLKDIIDIPILGTHNEKMEIDFDNVKVRLNGEIIHLSEFPNNNLHAQFQDTDHTLAEEITARTRKGGTRVLSDYKKKLDVDQSAVLATGAAIMKMADAVVHDKQVELPTVIYHIPAETGHWGNKRENGFVMGAKAILSADGASYDDTPSMVNRLSKAVAGARGDYQEAHLN